jgi:hypothetical protein
LRSAADLLRDLRYREHVAARLLAVLGVVAGAACAAPTDEAPSAPLPVCPDPDLLACSGLYGQRGESWPAKEVATDVIAYAPGVALWSDGLEKRRWLRLPPGERIDTTNPGSWVFPVGTAFWKEFAYRGHRIETRHMLKVNERAWYFMSYAWNADGTDTVAARQGVPNVAGTDHDSYEIPAAETCFTCHHGSADQVLGFEAVALAMPNASGLTLADLARRDLITQPVDAPVIPGNDVARAALGYLHMNCGVSCHNQTPVAEARWTNLHLRLEPGELGMIETTDTYRTAVGMPSGGDSLLRIAPGDAEHSALIRRATLRGDDLQMPPLGSHVVDAEGLALVRAWIQSLP